MPELIIRIYSAEYYEPNKTGLRLASRDKSVKSMKATNFNVKSIITSSILTAKALDRHIVIVAEYDGQFSFFTTLNKSDGTGGDQPNELSFSATM